jgi:hypothetical protein
MRESASLSVYFSYGHIFVFDRSVKLPGLAWTEGHHKQGFARRDKSVAFRTLLEFGEAHVSVHLGPYEPRLDHERVIEVPIESPTGEVGIEGPEEIGAQRFIRLEKGHYRLVAAQALDSDREAVDLYLEKVTAPLSRSRILVADAALAPSEPLIESTEVA